MAFLVTVLLLIFLLKAEKVSTEEEVSPKETNEFKLNTVMISVLVRNKEHTLPFFLNYLEKLDYPKDRIALSIISDHNIDRSLEVLEKWLSENKKNYHSVMSYLDKVSPPIVGESGVAHWPLERYTHVIYLRELAMSTARHVWADYIWVLDADIFITNPQTLKDLVSKGLPIAAPMLKSDGLYSNFWCGLTDEFYYKRTEDYSPILTRKKKGCHRVPMVHSSVLIDLRLRDSDRLTYDPVKLPGYRGPHDDIITFAQSANSSGLGMYVCNDEVYGFIMVPLEKDDQLSFDLLQLRNLKLEALVENGPLEASNLLLEYVKTPEEREIEVDKIYLINLERRPDRRRRMLQSLAELQLTVNIFNAVDGHLENVRLYETSANVKENIHITFGGPSLDLLMRYFRDILSDIRSSSEKQL